MIQLKDINYTVGGSQIISDLSLDIPKGKVVALIGPNGAGKSTLLSLMSRLIKAQSGQVLLEGEDVQTAQPDALAKRLAVLRQENVITSRLRVRDLISFGRYPHHKGRPDDTDRAHVDQAIERFGLGTFADRFLDELSGGQKQRALIAMILCQDTDYVLLDEPLNNLDLTHAQQLMRTLEQASREGGRTTVIVLHDINYASRYADHIIGLKNGGVAFSGATSDVFTSAHLSALFEVDVPVHEINGQGVSLHY